jgi:hypothetical protein
MPRRSSGATVTLATAPNRGMGLAFGIDARIEGPGMTTMGNHPSIPVH